MKKTGFQGLLKKGWLKDIAVYFLVFLTGFIGSILLINKKITELINLLVEGSITGKQDVVIFGIKVMEFHSVKHGAGYDIEMMRTAIYNYVPVIIGLGAVMIAVLLTLLIKKVLKSK